jgi:hypothetical protein
MMIVSIIAKESKCAGFPLEIRVLDHPKAPYSEDLLKLEVLDHEGVAVTELEVERTELVRLGKSFEIRNERK